MEAMEAGAQNYLAKDRATAEDLSLAIEKAAQRIALEADRGDRLARSLAEKEVQLQEVHHRVKNNLQVVSSLLRLQADTLDGQAAAALRESQQRVEAIALIHEQLYQSGDLRRVNLAEHASLLLDNLLTMYGGNSGRISGAVAMQPVVLGLDQAIPAALIVNELISNALKHAFPEGRTGRISVEGGLSQSQVVITVKDDGVGLPAEIDPLQAPSLGLRIVRILSRQLRGVFEVERGGGTQFRVSFPGGMA